ncbi:hypothetical protein PLUTE_a3527 [Pseudoalteromonas luteoviolacea DSM 6061]|nr:hypothetical protein [Pseudoalteromonas luteoviolacea DSM 6061]
MFAQLHPIFCLAVTKMKKSRQFFSMTYVQYVLYFAMYLADNLWCCFGVVIAKLQALDCAFVLSQDMLGLLKVQCSFVVREAFKKWL